MGGHEGEANQGVLRCYGWRYDGVNEDAGFEELFNDEEGEVVVADEKGDDRRGGFSIV